MNQSSSEEPIMNNNFKTGNLTLKKINNNNIYNVISNKSHKRESVSYNTNGVNNDKSLKQNKLIISKNNEESEMMKKLRAFQNKKINNLDTIKSKLNNKININYNQISNKFENVNL